MSTLGLVVHPTKPVGESIATIGRWTAAHDTRLVARAPDRERVGDVPVLPDDEFAASVDGVIALGGDGTMLGAMRLVSERPVPVLGVNHGNLGFLVEVAPPALEAALNQLVSGDFTVETWSCLSVEGFGPAFNDVVLGRPDRKAVSVDLTVNGQRYGYYTCDALVVSTPGGSTAYNYAAGGPVMSPSVAGTVITPVAPMAGISRSVVLGSDDRISLHVGSAAAVDIDGTPAGSLGPGDTLTVALRPEAAQVVRLSAELHAGRSRVKLSLLDLPLRPDQLLELIPEEFRHRLTRD